jgi:CRP-like cAMP-binding protein
MVVLRRSDGTEVNLGTRPHGAVLGEMSLLTGEPRSATVRAIEGALVYEVGRRQYEPLLAGRPDLVEALSRAMEERLRAQGQYLDEYDAERRATVTGWVRRLRANA